ncbi:MAG: chemotaxis protein CheV [Gammaproteobacteria bacterium]|jgi:two-component system chemotaxis response regulator CheV|nr:chemotaxis protein CheV [Gammaproteobacteria bacterium]
MASGLLESIDRSTQLAGHNRLALLLFRLDERQIFGINVFKVQEVIPKPALSWLPSSHPLVKGVADIRGRMIPVIDLSRAIGQPSDEQAAHVIVTEYNRSVQGFLVRAVERIIHVNVEHVRPPPDGAGEGGYMTAITQYNNELVEIIDVEKVLSDVVGVQAALSESIREEAAGIGASRRRVLVVDDSRVARNQIEKTLNQLGIECTMVNDGREALRYLQALAAKDEPITDTLLMMISDVEMPDMDGYRLTTEIRRDPKMKNLYVMLHTSLSGVFNSAMAERVGADRFIAKFSADELATSVLDHLKAVVLESA